MRWVERVRALFTKARLDGDLDEELAEHLEMLVESKVRGGMDERTARREAHMELGNAAQLKEAHRDMRGVPFLETVGQDLRYAVRTLRKDWRFTVFAVLIVCLGVGASSTVFSVINAVLLRPLPVQEPDRLVWLANVKSKPEQTSQIGHMTDLAEQSKTLGEVAAYFAYYAAGGAKVVGDGDPERVTGVPVTQNFFPMLGVNMQLGRNFTPEESTFEFGKNKAPVVVLSHGLWVRRYGADPKIIGRTINVNDETAAVIGVTPESFDFAGMFTPGARADLYSPFPLTKQTNRWGNTMAMVGRLRPGATVEAAQSEAAVLSGRLEQEHLKDRNEFQVKVSSLREHVSGRLRTALYVLVGAIAAVMLIVCANLSNLLLARTAMRQKEMAIRSALGAGRGRLIRQMFTESLLLSGVGAGLGALLAVAGTRMVAGLEGFNIPMLSAVRTDFAALGVILLLAVLNGLLFGLAPAFQMPGALKEKSGGGKRGAAIRNALVISEVAFACVLLVGAGLLMRSFLHVLEVNMGYQPERAAAVRIDPGNRVTTPEQLEAFIDESLRRTREVRGIEAVGLADVLPFAGNRSWGVAAKGQTYTRENYPSAFVRIVSEGYFGAMGIPLRQGRTFTERDGKNSENVMVINETLAKRLWPGQDAVGQMVTQNKGTRVIGVVADVRHHALEEAGGAEMYYPLRQSGDFAAVYLIYRTTQKPTDLAGAVREALRPMDPNIGGSDFRAVQQDVDRAISPRRFTATMLVAFSVFALVLASLGIYAVISYSVGQRTQEIGIRIALGASARNVEGGILRHTLALAAVGVTIGAAASWVLARAMGGLLFGVTADDPATFGSVVVLLAGVAAVAGYLPARRASRIDPAVALRSN